MYMLLLACHVCSSYRLAMTREAKLYMLLFISFLVAMETNTIERNEKQANQQNYNTHNDKLHNKHTSSMFYTVLERTCILKNTKQFGFHQQREYISLV